MDDVEANVDIHMQLFVGSKIYLGPIDHENDPIVVSKWSHDAEYLRLIDTKPVCPISEGQARKYLEAIEKEMEESKSLFYFTIRLKENSSLLGYASINWIEWTHDTGWIRLGIGDKVNWRQGYGTDVITLLLDYSFNELNLHRLGAEIIEYNGGAKSLFEKAGFLQEVCRRKALKRDGKWWDVLLYGLLKQDWEDRQVPIGGRTKKRGVK